MFLAAQALVMGLELKAVPQGVVMQQCAVRDPTCLKRKDLLN
jgi:hypothetical protein